MGDKRKGTTMYNKVILIGNLTRDVNLKYLPSGSAVAEIGLATNRTWIDKNTNEKKQEVTFIDVNIFGRPAETANQYLKKGSKVLVEGRLAQDTWTDNEGKNRSKHKVIAETLQFLDSKEKDERDEGDYKPTPKSKPKQNYEVDNDDISSDIPF